MSRKNKRSEYEIFECSCGKRFIPTYHWLYKLITKTNKTEYFCSYTCWRKAGGGGDEKRKYTRIK